MPVSGELGAELGGQLMVSLGNGQVQGLSGEVSGFFGLSGREAGRRQGTEGAGLLSVG